METRTKEELIDDFVSSLSKIIEIKDDINHELRYSNYKYAIKIKEERFYPEVESLKIILSTLLDNSKS